jgi:hypothetical protein
MAITMNGKPLTLVKPKKKKSTHLKAETYTGSFTEPGKFRKANWMYYLNLSHSAIHARMMVLNLRTVVRFLRSMRTVLRTMIMRKTMIKRIMRDSKNA